MVYKCRAYFALVLVVLVLAEAFPNEKSKYENLDVVAICKNKRLLKSYVLCVQGKGPCTAEGRDLKERIPKALGEKCLSCSEDDKERVRMGVNCVRCSSEEDWTAIVEHFDPENKHAEYIKEFFGEKSC